MRGPYLLNDLLTQIKAYEARFQGKSHGVSLVAASKQQTSDKIRKLYQEGQRAFGENHLQEALEKMMALRDCEIEWHFIGPIQSNKTKKIAENFAWVQSIDSEKIAKRLHDQRPLTLSPLNVCIEVNIDEEPTKRGVLPDSVWSLVHYCRKLSRLSVRGLMAIPRIKDNFHDQCASFHEMFMLWQACKERLVEKEQEVFDTLSMGMSADFEAAIKEGATMVRIGTALFGERP